MQLSGSFRPTKKTPNASPNEGSAWASNSKRAIAEGPNKGPAF